MKSTNFLVIISKEIGGLIMENLKLPKIGLRTIKSGIAVFLCLALLPSEPFFACLTAVICLQDTVLIKNTEYSSSVIFLIYYL